MAPHIEASAIGHALTLRRPLRLETIARRRLRGGRHADRLREHRAHALFKRQPDLIVSGINKGWNLGDDVTYSGTVAGALEGALLGIPSIAVSLRARARTLRLQPRRGGRRDDRRGGARARAADAHVPEHQRADGQPKGFAPPCRRKRNHVTVVDRAHDPRGRPYYWIEEGQNDWEPHDRSDYQAVRDGYVSVTPLQPDLTAHDALVGGRDAVRSGSRSWCEMHALRSGTDSRAVVEAIGRFLSGRGSAW